MHLQDAAHTLALALGGIEDGGTRGQCTGVHAEEAQTAHIGVGHDLESQRGEGLIIRRLALLFLVCLGVDALDGRDVGRCGHVVHDGVQQLLHALVSIAGAAGHRHHFHGAGSLADSGTDLAGGDLLPLQIQLHDLVVEHGHGIQQLLAVLVGDVDHILGDRLDAHILTQLIVVDIGVHLHQVDDTLEGILLPDGKLDGDSVGLQAVMHHVQHMVEIRAGDIHLIDVDHPGDMVVIGLTPHRLGLRLHVTVTEPSSTRRERSTSTVKSTWPGVSMMLMRVWGN